MRKLSIVLAVTFMFLLTIGGGAMAQGESQQTALTLNELMDWSDSYLERARGTEPLNDPTAEESKTEEGYLYIYDFANLYLDTPTLTAESKLNALLITVDEVADPRGILIDDTLDTLLNAYYTENPTMLGDENFAALYVSDLMPEAALWAWIQRDGQHVSQVQYAVHDQMSSGGSGYTDCGLSFTIEEGYVVAIRAYGLTAQITQEQAEDNVDQVSQVMSYDSYKQFPSSMVGTDLTPFQVEDLDFYGLDYLNITPDQAKEIMGEMEYEDWMADGDKFLCTMTMEAGVATFLYDNGKQPLYLDTLVIDGQAMEGPRGVRIGDTLSSVIMRFCHNEGTFDGSTETLYGDGLTPPYGIAEYDDDASALLRYALVTDNGVTVTLYMTFENNALTEIMLYRW